MATMTDYTNDDVATSREVVETVAAKEGVDPTDLSPPLYTAIDPDVLDAMFSERDQREGVGRLVFEYLGYEVTVRGDGGVSVAENGDGRSGQGGDE